MTTRLAVAMTCAWLFAGGTQALAAGHAVAFRASDGTSLSAVLYEADHQPAPAVVLVHMLTRTHADWAAFANELQQAGFHVLAIDLRGHGDSGGRYDPDGDLGVMQQDVKAVGQRVLRERQVHRTTVKGIVGRA
jgi:alpha-beta hydrolase superfamily lysophospholipase